MITFWCFSQASLNVEGCWNRFAPVLAGITILCLDLTECCSLRNFGMTPQGWCSSICDYSSTSFDLLEVKQSLQFTSNWQSSETLLFVINLQFPTLDSIEPFCCFERLSLNKVIYPPGECQTQFSLMRTKALEGEEGLILHSVIWGLKNYMETF